MKKTALRIRDSLILSTALVATMLFGCAQSTPPADSSSGTTSDTTSGSSSGTASETASNGLAITSPSAGSSIAASTFTVSGTYSADTAPASVTVYFGTSSYSATVDSAAKTWTAEVATPNVAAGTGKVLKAVAAWASGTKTAIAAYDYANTSVTGYSISGTVSFLSGVTIPSGNLYIYAIPENIDNPVASESIILGEASHYDYTLTGLPNGYYTIRAYTCPAGTTTYVAGTSFWNFDGGNVLMKGANYSTSMQFYVYAPTTSAPSQLPRSVDVGYPLSGAEITDGTVVATGTWTGDTTPKSIVVQFGDSNDLTTATVNADGTWTASIAASTYITKTCSTESFAATAKWAYTIPNTTALNIAYAKSWNVDYEGPVAPTYKVTLKITLPSALSSGYISFSMSPTVGTSGESSGSIVITSGKKEYTVTRQLRANTYTVSVSVGAYSYSGTLTVSKDTTQTCVLN